jgi:hypothetical protein
MAGRRQVWTGFALLLLTLALPASALAPSRSGTGWEAAALVATALLLSVCASRMVVVPTRFAMTGPLACPDVLHAAVLTRFSPNAPGRPEQPRAPGNHR